MRKKQVLIEECKKHLRDSKKYEHEYKKDIRKLITELEKQLTLTGVSHQRELLKSFANEAQEKMYEQPDNDLSDFVDAFIKDFNCG